MADYKEIHGQKIKVLSSDPVTTSPGDIWYNSTDYQVKGYYNETIPSAWSSGGNLITGRKCLGGSNQGTVNSFCVWGGNCSSSGYCAFSCTEVYNGSSWSTGPSMITAVRNSQNGGGTSSAFATGGVEGTVSSGYAILTTQELA